MSSNTVTLQQHATILAALRWYQACGMGDPDSRPDWLHDIAWANGDTTSLDDEGIDELCYEINTEWKIDGP